MKKAFYIGRFPPPYGGSTVKNYVLYQALSNKIQLEKFDTSKLKISSLYYIKLFIFLVKNFFRKGFICVSTGSLFKIIKIIEIFFNSMISNISLFIVGGRFDEYVTNEHIDVFKRFNMIYVETEIMYENLKNYGFKNIKVLPNCRNKSKFNSLENKNNKIRLVYIGRLCKEKGIDIILKAADELNRKSRNIIIDLYGPIEDNVENGIITNNNVNYLGVLEVGKHDIIEVLSQYDVFLFPTQAYQEGIPGAIIESKIAANAIIANRWKNIDCILKNNYDSIIIDKMTHNDLANSIIMLDENRDLLNKIKINASATARKYIIDNYIDEIINDSKN